MTPARENSVHFGVKWLGVAMWSSLLVRLGTTALLARLLEREAFGLVTMALTGIAAIAAFSEAGFSQALIRHRSLDDEEERLAADTVFWILQSMNALLFVVAWSLAPAIAEFYDKIEGLEPVLRALLFVFLVEGFSAVSGALLQKRMAFSSISRNEIEGVVTYAGTAITLALLGCGVWSLVVGQLVSRVYQLVRLLSMAGWWPRPRFNRRLALEMFRFGGWLWANGVLTAFTRSTDKLVLGKLADGAVLGSYGVAWNLCASPERPASRIIRQVAFPALAKLQEDEALVRRSYGRGIELVSFIALPAAVGLAAVASDFVTTVYGEKWSDMAGLVQVLSFRSLAMLLGAISGSVLLARGLSREILRVSVGRQILFLALVFPLARFEAIGVAWAVTAPTVASMIVGHVVALRACGMALRDVARPLARSVAATAGMLACVGWAASLLEGVGPALRLVVTVTFGAAAYFGLSLAVNRGAVHAALDHARRVLGSRS